MERSAPAPDSPLDPDPLDEPDDLRRELSAARRQADEYRDLLRQTRADFADYRRKVEQERAEQADQTRVELLLRVLPILDELERCLAQPRDQRQSDRWMEDIEAAERKLRAVLHSEGVERIEAAGALYNPWEHEAIQSQASPELEDQRILAVVREGYRIGDRVIRPAQVVVARRSR